MEEMEESEETIFRHLKVARVKLDLPSAACRYALTTLTGGRDVAVSSVLKASKKPLVDAVAGLVRLWRARLCAMQREDWGFLLDDSTRIQFAGCCPPVGVVMTGNQAFPCHQYQICPFCWCRKHVLDLLARLYGVWRNYNERTLPFDLIEVRTERLYPVDAYYVSSTFDWIKHDKSTYYRSYLSRAYGGFVLCTVEPPNRSKSFTGEPCYRLYHRLLALVPKSMPTPSDDVAPLDSNELQVVTRRVHRTCNPGNVALSAAVGRICIYPAQLLRGKPDEAIEILDAQSMTAVRNKQGQARKKFPVRMSEYYGCLRKHRQGLLES